MKRHPALQDLSRDHFHVLFRCQRLRRALSQTGNWAELQSLIEEFLTFFASDMSPHFAEEDEIVVPAAAKRDELRNVARQTIDEHRTLRGLIGKLSDVRRIEDEARTLLARLEPQITHHVKMEEEQLFEGVQAILTETELRDVGARSAAFRRQHRHPDASGPRPGRG